MPHYIHVLCNSALRLANINRKPKSLRSNKLDMTKELCNMEARLVWRRPSAKSLVRVNLRADDGSEKVHPPRCALGLANVDVEDAQRDSDSALPSLCGLVKNRLRAKTVRSGIRNEEVVEGCADRAILGGIVNKRLVCDVVGVDLELDVCLRVFGALVEEGLHDFVLPDVVVCALRGVEEVVDLIVGNE